MRRLAKARGWVIGGVVVVGVAVFLVVGHGSVVPEEPAVRAAAMTASRPGSTTPFARVGPPASAPGQAAHPDLPPGWLEVCNAEPLSPEAASAVDGARARGVLARVDTVLGQLQVHPDPASRAAGIALADSMDFARTLAEFGPASGACADKACQAAVWKRVKEKERALAERRRTPLVHLALSSGDVGIYALAAQLCSGIWQETGPCRQVSLAEWARREPDNMAPWLWLAKAAQERQDLPGRDEALFRVAAGSRQDHHHGLVTRAVLAALPGDADGESQLHLLALALQVRDTKLLPMFNMSAACTPDLLRDANRWQRCDALAEALTRRGNSMLELRYGTRIGEAVGWSRDRVAGLRDEAEAMGHAHGLVLGTERALSCRAIAAFRHFIAETGEVGELATARSMVTRLGASPAELAAAHRARMIRLQAMADRPVDSVAAPASAAASEVTR